MNESRANSQTVGEEALPNMVATVDRVPRVEEGEGEGVDPQRDPVLVEGEGVELWELTVVPPKGEGVEDHLDDALEKKDVNSALSEH